MFSNIRQKLSDLFANPANESNDSKISLLEKIGGVFNFGGDTTINKINSQQTALRNVSAQINLSNDEINHQLRRQAVRERIISPTMNTNDNSALYLAGGYGLLINFELIILR